MMSKSAFYLLLMIVFSGCAHKSQKDTAKEEYVFYVGTYTNGKSDGIYKYRLNADGTLDSVKLVAITENPSFLCLSNDKKYLLAVNENEQGTVESFKIEQETLQFVNRQSSGGAHPCFVSSNKQSFVVTTNYTGGNIGLLRIDKQGKLTELLDIEQHTGNSSTERQKAPHAHSAWFVPDNQNQIISVDLGTNELWFSEIIEQENRLTPVEPFKLAMKKGAGPRHLTFHPNNKWIYVINELNCTITQVKKSKNEYKTVQSVTTLPKDYVGENTCAHVVVTADGNYLYASNRGHNSIVIYQIDRKNGNLQLVGFEPTRGNSPRNFAFSNNQQSLLVANQHSNNIVSFKRNIENGKLTFVDEINAPSPVCLLFN